MVLENGDKPKSTCAGERKTSSSKTKDRRKIYREVHVHVSVFDAQLDNHRRRDYHVNQYRCQRNTLIVVLDNYTRVPLYLSKILMLYLLLHEVRVRLTLR
jgi:hypothetical protein